MRVWLGLVFLFLAGCNWWSSNPVDSPKLNNKNIHEQKNSSKINDKNWVERKYPEKCEWLGFGRVVDGDTVIVFDNEGQVRVRMIGIDTPESKKEGTPIQPYALESSRALKELIGDPLQLCLIQDELGDQLDIYGRRLSYLFTEAGLDLNAKMIEGGWARAYLSFPFERSTEFKDLELIAKEAKVGRWQ